MGRFIRMILSLFFIGFKCKDCGKREKLPTSTIQLEFGICSDCLFQEPDYCDYCHGLFRACDLNNGFCEVCTQAALVEAIEAASGRCECCQNKFFKSELAYTGWCFDCLNGATPVVKYED